MNLRYMLMAGSGVSAVFCTIVLILEPLLRAAGTPHSTILMWAGSAMLLACLSFWSFARAKW